jgi:WD40 repeat protein
MVLTFQNFVFASGTFLACATGGRQMYKIKIYNVANGSLAATLPGHHEIVYDMEWGNNVLEDVNPINQTLRKPATKETDPRTDKGVADGEAGEKGKEGALGKLLLTASADTTAKVWCVETRQK